LKPQCFTYERNFFSFNSKLKQRYRIDICNLRMVYLSSSSGPGRYSKMFYLLTIIVLSEGTHV